MGKYSFDCVVFDLDGVITRTAKVHAKAWKTVFDDYLRLREKRDGESFREFTHEKDYLPYVDGKPRYKGVQSFLESRGINIPFGDPSDTPDKETTCGIGNKKNDLFREILLRDGADVFSSSIDLINKLKKSGVRIAVASSSKNCQLILESVSLQDLFETRVDGVVSAELGLKGKPEGDIFVVAANNLGAEPANSVIVEDATSGVQAGRNGGFGLVLGVARENNEGELIKNGADVVVRDIEEITVEWIDKWFKRKPRPLLKSWDAADKFPFEPNPKAKGNNITINPCYNQTAKDALFNEKRLVFFLDYDGTLTPIVERPELAVLSKKMRDSLSRLSAKCTVAIVSGRMRDDVEKLVQMKGLFYAGSHGFDINGPGFSMVQPKAKEAVPLIDKAIETLKKELTGIKGVLIEEKKFSVAAHYRLVDKKYVPRIEGAVKEIVKNNEALRFMSGKKVFEILPNIHWDKGQAIRWIMEALKISWSEASVVYIGDDVTDEYAFRTVRTRGTGILVSEKLMASAADFELSSADKVRELFEKVIALSP
jgi:alpha,alpha-trehalase